MPVLIPVLPFLENRMDYGLGRYGWWDATDMEPGKTIIGFPVDDLLSMVFHLEYLVK